MRYRDDSHIDQDKLARELASVREDKARREAAEAARKAQEAARQAAEDAERRAGYRH